MVYKISFAQRCVSLLHSKVTAGLQLRWETAWKSLAFEGRQGRTKSQPVELILVITVKQNVNMHS